MLKPNFAPKLDKVVGVVVGLGVPGLFFLILLSGSGLGGAAAIAAALSAFGPGGMIGGLISLPVAVLIFKGVSEYGVEKILVAALKRMQSNGETKEEIFEKIDNFKIGKNLKAELKAEIDKVYDFREAQAKEYTDGKNKSGNEAKQDTVSEGDTSQGLGVIKREVENNLRGFLMNIILQNTPMKKSNLKEYKKFELKTLKEELENEKGNNTPVLKILLQKVYAISKQEGEDKLVSYLKLLRNKYNQWIFEQFEAVQNGVEEMQEFHRLFDPLLEEFLRDADPDEFFEALLHTGSEI